VFTSTFNEHLLTRIHIKLISREYVPELERARARKEQTLRQTKEESMSRLMGDLEMDRKLNPDAASHDRWDPEEEEKPGRR